ncbi:alpha-E domain-containing protein [Mycobacterium lepromatosis]|uniref:alpha-E domain-containing protein n=1 Tax=Mycobacterium lepromatosis TaxID=480418 RepID=UPI00067859AF|nr:alpha-E domain-containing protein [Mycobacterium lepromatosis]
MLKTGGTRGISPLRVLSDIFWVGRYAELTAGMARLLVFTRERYHEFHHREDIDGSKCVLVVLIALGQATSTDITDAQATLGSLTTILERRR